ncbi:hypothetical protein JCM8097_000640 [Rhodosporidiobolus ruineniae]
MASKRSSASTNPALGGSWSPSPSPSPSPPSSPKVDLSISDADRFKLLEDHAPIRPSDLGFSSGVRGKGKGKEPLVVVSPEELEELVRRQQEGASGEDEDGYGEPEPAEEEDMALWEEVANAVLWSVPFAFLYSGMDYAVHSQFGQRLVLREEFTRILNVLPALLLLNFLTLRPPSRRLLPPLLLQLLLFLLSVTTGLALIHLTTTAGYLQVMARAPVMGTLWCWTIVRLDLGWAVGALVGVAVGVTVRGEAGAVRWWA